MKAVVGEESNGAPPAPARDVVSGEDVSRAGCCQLSCGIGVHVDAAAETVGEKEDVSAAPRRDGWKAEVVDADENAGAAWKRQGKGRPANDLVRSLARLALEAAAEPPSGRDVNTNLQIEVRNHAECPRSTRGATGGGVARVQGPRAHPH